jgi:hypothetical protein
MSKNSLKQYEKKRDQIRDNKKVSELEKGTMHFNNWIDYITTSAKTDQPKYQHEQIRIRV